MKRPKRVLNGNYEKKRAIGRISLSLSLFAAQVFQLKSCTLIWRQA